MCCGWSAMTLLSEMAWSHLYHPYVWGYASLKDVRTKLGCVLLDEGLILEFQVEAVASTAAYMLWLIYHLCLFLEHRDLVTIISALVIFSLDQRFSNWGLGASGGPWSYAKESANPCLPTPCHVQCHAQRGGLGPGGKYMRSHSTRSL